MGKIRVGFVTNSSSCSFIAYGVMEEELPPLSGKVFSKLFDQKLKYYRDTLEKEQGKYKDWCQKQISEMELISSDEDKENYIREMYGVEDVYSEMRPFSYANPWGDGMIGIPLASFEYVFPDKTFSEARELTANALNDAFGTEFTVDDITLFEEVWRDG